jgi:hypothetical protein
MQEVHILRPRTHNGFLDMRYDERYTPLLQRAGLDAISYAVRRGLPLFNASGITALVDRYLPQWQIHPFFCYLASFICKPLVCLTCRWRPETHSFHMSFGEMTISLEDAQKMLGLRIIGLAVTGSTRNEGWRERVQAFLGRELPPAAPRDRTAGIPITWLRGQFGNCPENADAETVGYYCRAWILHLFGCVLFPDATGDSASWMYIQCLNDWDQAGQYSWGSAVLAFLYRQLCEACRRNTTSSSIGIFLFLN